MNADIEPAEGKARQLSRRDVLGAGVAGVAAAATGGGLLGLGDSIASAAAAPDGNPLGPSLNGTLKNSDAGDALVFENYHLSLDWASSGLPAVGGAEALVQVDDDSLLFRDEPCDVAGFRAGDHLVAFVKWDGSDLIALSVQPVYVGIEGEVDSSGDDWLKTSGGTVLFTENTILRTDRRGQTPAPLREIASSERAAVLGRFKHIGATCRFDSASGDYVAANITEIGAS